EVWQSKAKKAVTGHPTPKKPQKIGETAAAGSYKKLKAPSSRGRVEAPSLFCYCLAGAITITSCLR
ncbi:MAG TPA: hypothetical protein VLA93_03470, partial [Pyrinomonadaceae bacterium]|nr:hypothetical protein [Pyrinomonadaceae bacterium]